MNFKGGNLSVEHRVSNMSQMSISSQLSKNNSIRHHTRSETPSQHQHSATPTPRESIVFNRGDEKPIAKILLNLNNSLKFNQSKDKNNEEDENQKLVESNYHEIESKNTSQTGSIRLNKENNSNNILSLSNSTSMTEFRAIIEEQKCNEECSATNILKSVNPNAKTDALIKTKIDQFNSINDSSIRQNNESYSNAIKNLVFDKENQDNIRITENDLIDEEIVSLSKDIENTAQLMSNYDEFLEFEKNKKIHRPRPNKAAESFQNNIRMNDSFSKEVKSNNNISKDAFFKNPDKTIILQPNGDQNYNSLKSNDHNGSRIKNESKSDISISHSFSKKCFKCCTIS